MALVVEKKFRCVARKSDEVVLKKLRTSFQASELVVENARPSELKCDADVVEKKLFWVFQ